MKELKSNLGDLSNHQNSTVNRTNRAKVITLDSDEDLQSPKMQNSSEQSLSQSTHNNMQVSESEMQKHLHQMKIQSINRAKNPLPTDVDHDNSENSNISATTQHEKQNHILDLLKQQMQNGIKKKDEKLPLNNSQSFAETLDEEQIILPNINNKYENTKNVETDCEEDTNFGQGVLLRDGSVSHETSENPDNWRPNLIIANIIHIFLIISGVYCCFLGFRFFKLTMILLGLDFSYYFVILFLTEFDIYDVENIGHQLGVFFGSLILGFAVSILSYVYEKSQFVIIGVAISSMISVFIAQFFIDFEDKTDKIVILCIYLSCSVIFTIAAYAAQHSTLIWGTVIVGSILATINFGVLLNDFKSFEQREKLPNDRFSDFVNYLIANAVLICLGLLVQFYLKKKIIQRLRKEDEEMDSDMYTIRATTFL